MTEQRNRRPDVAIFTRSMDGGGAERFTARLANQFAEWGLTVELILQYETGPYLRILDPSIGRVILDRRVRNSILPLAAYLKRQRPRSLVSVMTENNAGALIASALTRFHGPVVVCERNSLHQPRAVPASWVKALIRFLYPRASRVVAVSRAMRDELIELGLKEPLPEFIPNPIDIQGIEAGARHAVAHPFLDGGVPVLLSMGRLVEQKDFPTLIRAVAILRRSRNVRLLVLGEGELKEELLALVDSYKLSEFVDFIGFQDPPWAWLTRADVLVMSSRFEGWPNTILEALALGIPVVSTDCPTGPHEILQGGRLGELVPVGDPEALAAGIDRALEGPRDPAVLRAGVQGWSVEEIAGRYLDLLGIGEKV